MRTVAEGEYYVVKTSEDGPVLMPPVVTAYLDDGSIVRFEIDDDYQYVVTSLHIDTTTATPITAKTLTRLKLGDLAKEVTRRNARHATLDDDGRLTMNIGDMLDGISLNRETHRIGSFSATEKRTPMTPELLADVHQRATAAKANGQLPTRVLARHYGKPESTVRNWIRAARKAHDNGGTR